MIVFLLDVSPNTDIWSSVRVTIGFLVTPLPKALLPQLLNFAGQQLKEETFSFGVLTKVLALQPNFQVYSISWCFYRQTDIQGFYSHLSVCTDFFLLDFESLFILIFRFVHQSRGMYWIWDPTGIWIWQEWWVQVGAGYQKINCRSWDLASTIQKDGVKK